jgi:hypothetical protein
MLFRASSADGRQCGARPEGWTSLTGTDDVAADQEALRDPGGLAEPWEQAAPTVSRTVPLHAPDDLRYLG